jgi:hypothetical protein
MYNPCNFDYFKSPDRIGDINDVQEVVHVLKVAFEKIYSEANTNKNEKLKTYEAYEHHEFFHKIADIFVNPKTLDPEKAKCSDVFADYICKVARVTNPQFFEKIVIFVTLFRECLNTQNKKETTDNSEYTEENCAEDAPDISNEFVTEYLENDIAFYGFQKEEVIDITQNFCQWLYDNNFTCSKLSLISNL